MFTKLHVIIFQNVVTSKLFPSTVHIFCIITTDLVVYWMCTGTYLFVYSKGMRKTSEVSAPCNRERYIPEASERIICTGTPNILNQCFYRIVPGCGMYLINTESMAETCPHAYNNKFNNI
jgi:hypothetical protein